MVDVKVKMEEYASFPTMIYKFNTNIDKKDNVKMASYIKDNDEMQTEDKLYKVSLFNPLLETIHHTTQNVLDKLEYEYEKLEVTSMWGTLLKKGQAHPAHTHSNNLWSGVYYVKSSENASPIQFFDPRSQAHLLKPKHKSNWQNSGMLQFDAEVGCGLIFPSWLMHWVPPTQEERISVSWNIILRGDYGSHEEYQYANI